MLKDAWVDRILTRLVVRYGNAWLRAWEGIDPEAIKQDWAEELGGMSSDSLAYALANLPPDRPPTVGQFRAIALTFRPSVTLLPPARRVQRDPAAARRIAEQVRATLKDRPILQARQWAWDLREIELHRGGLRPFDALRPLPEAMRGLTHFQRSAWRAALARQVRSHGDGIDGPEAPT